MYIFDETTIDQAAQALLDHQILAVPTDTVYGITLPYGDLRDLEKLKNFKHRPETKALPFTVCDEKMFEQIGTVDERTHKIIKEFLPGALTLIVKRKENTDPAWTNGQDTIAIRIPDAPLLLELIRKTGRPLLLTSANESGQPACLNQEEVERRLPELYGLCKGECKAGQASTILDCTGKDLKILRQGPVSLEEITEKLSTQ